MTADDEVVIVHGLDEGGVGFVITELWAYLAVHDDGDEGIIAWTSPGGITLPLIAADRARLDKLRYAEATAQISGKPVVLVRFLGRVEVERLG